MIQQVISPLHHFCRQCHLYQFSIPAVTNYYRFSILNQYLFITSQFCRSEVLVQWGLPQGICLKSCKTIIEKSPELYSFQEALGKIHFQVYSSCFLDSTTCGCRTEVAGSLPSVHQGLILCLEAAEFFLMLSMWTLQQC